MKLKKNWRDRTSAMIPLNENKQPKLNSTAIVLAGGQSSRMHQNKAFLCLDGVPLIERTLRILSDIFREILISSNEPDLYRAYDFPVVQDQMPGQGPLAGLQAGLSAARYNECFFVACDMPFLNAPLIRFLTQAAESFDIVVPEAGAGLHPLHAVYRKSCLPHIENNLQAGRLKIIDFYPSCTVRVVNATEIVKYGNLNTLFSNVNTPDEWAKALAMMD